MLNKKWKEILYAFTPFGANFVMIAIMAYFTDAVDVRLLSADKQLWSFNSVTIVMPILFGVLWTIGRVFDGFIDIPFASFTDKMNDKAKRVKLPIMIGAAPMILGALALCFPLSTEPESGLNTAWFFIMAIVFFASYTLTLIAFYGSLSSVCADQKQRQRVSSYKAIIDTIIYSVVYALIPLLLKAFSVNILTFIACCTPLMLTILIPLFLFRGKSEESEDIDEKEIESVGLIKSIIFVFKNRVFWSWLLVNGMSFFGLQMFLAAQNALVSGVMNLGASYSAILNTAAFAPVPLMIFLMYKLINTKGIRFTFRVALATFAVGIMGFFFASEFFFRNSVVVQVIIGCAGGTIASFAIGAFFAMPIMIPSQVAAVERQVTKRNNSAMYFAGQAAVTSLLGAFATGIVYASIKGIEVTASDGYVVPLGGMLVPIIVAACCAIAFALTFFMPKDYDINTIGKFFDPSFSGELESVSASGSVEDASGSVEDATGSVEDAAE